MEPENPSSLAVEVAAPVPGVLQLEATPFVLGEPTTITVSSAAPGATVYLGYSFSGPGNGPCPAPLGGDCLGLANPVQLLGTYTADGNGQVELTLPLPNALPVAEISLQAAVLRGTADLSNVLEAPFLDANGDEDADGLSNVEELDLGTDPLEADSDGGGGLDGQEVGVGIDPLDPGDDVTLTLDSFDAELDLSIAFSGALAGAACTFAGVCDCSATYTSSGTRVGQDGLRVIFEGPWELSTTDCAAAVTLDDFVWVPASGDVVHSLTFGPGASTLATWVAHADPTNFEPILDPQAAAAAQQASVLMDEPWDGVSTIVFTDVQNTSQLGVDVSATAVSTVTFN